MDLIDVAALEAAESSIDRFIEKRAREAKDANAIEELWKESARRHCEKRREENAAAWRSYHLSQAERLEQTAAELAASHRRLAAELGEVGI